MTDEVCADKDEFIARLSKMSMRQFAKRILTFVKKETAPTPDALNALVEYSTVCWLPVVHDDPTSTSAHLYQRRATRCKGCTEYSEMFIWDASSPEHVWGCISEELGFRTSFVKGWKTCFWVDKGYIAAYNTALHDTVTRVALSTLLPTVLAPFYAYGCADRGVVITPVSDVPAWSGMEAWLDTLASVNGFLVAPTPMFNEKGQITSLETLCWTHPDNPKVRWMAPMCTHPVRMQIPEGGVSAFELAGMQQRQRWFYTAVRGGMPASALRDWNTWVTLCSLALSPWPEGHVKFLTSVTPKEPLTSKDICMTYVMSKLNL